MPRVSKILTLSIDGKRANIVCSRASFDASGKHVVEEAQDCKTVDKTNPTWSPSNPGKFYRKITTNCSDKLTTFAPSKISAVA